MAEQKEQAEKPALDLRKILSMIFVAVNLVGVGAGAFLTYSATLGHRSPAAFEGELNEKYKELRADLDQEPIYYSLDAFATNLDGFPRRFVKIDMSVEMYDKEGYEELVSLGGESRDAILQIIHGKKLQDLETLQGKLHLKNEIIAHLNEALLRGVVKNIYYTNFHVQ